MVMRMADPVHRAAMETPERVGLVDATTDQTWTFREYDAAVDSMARRLRALDVGPGTRVGILSETTVTVPLVFFACWRTGATAVLLNARLTTEELRSQCGVAAPDLLLTSTHEAERATRLDIVAPAYALGTSDTELPGFTDVEATPETLAPVEHDADVALLFTSGTTGTPKAVRVTESNLEAAANAHHDRFGSQAGDRWLCPLSTYHMGGLMVLVRSAYYGTTAILEHTTEGFNATRTRETLAQYDCTAMSIVPVMLRRLLDEGPLSETLRFVLIGGAPTPRSLVERAVAAGVPICPTYGMTETTSQVATPTPDVAADHPDTVGHPLDGVTVRIIDDDGNPVERGTLGEIVVSGPTVSPGYLHGTDAAFTRDDFHTGDVGRFDEGGRLVVLNRREDRIITGGENVHPGEVAGVLADHEDVADVAVIGIPDPEWGERVAALVVPGEASLDAATLEEYARERLAGYKIPRTFVFVDDLPRTASGTVDRERARDLVPDPAER